MPQAIDEGGDMQTPFAQQPLGHETWLQTQLPLLTDRPGGTGRFAATATRSRRGVAVVGQPGGANEQAAPPTPQAPSPCVWQAPPAQRPAGHERTSQTQAPSTQLFPAPHAGCSPQVQTPATEQPSARDGITRHTGGATGAAGLTNPVGVQVDPEQQPGQAEVQVLQTPLMQVPPLQS